MVFVLHLPTLIPYLKNYRVFSRKVKIYFFSIAAGRMYLILFIALDQLFLQVRLQICCYLWGLRGLIGPGDVNISIFRTSNELIRDSQRLHFCNFVRL